MSGMRDLARILVAVLCVALAWPLAAEEPMRDEDVVRMVIQGVPQADIVAEIRSRVTAFDLSDEMVDELKIAGVPAGVIAEMRRRQAEIDGPAPDEVVEVPDPEAEYERPPVLTLGITVRVGGKDVPDGEPAVLEFPTAASDVVGNSLELDPAPDARAIGSAATYVMCTTSTHVPDHWRRESSLGRDFLTVPRHRLLSFQPDATIAGEGGDARLRAAVPESIELSLETEVTHMLQVGVALEIGGRYYGGLIVSEPREFVLAPEGGDVVLGVEIDAPTFGDTVGRFEVRIVDPPDPD